MEFATTTAEPEGLNPATDDASAQTDPLSPPQKTDAATQAAPLTYEAVCQAQPSPPSQKIKVTVLSDQPVPSQLTLTSVGDGYGWMV